MNDQNQYYLFLDECGTAELNDIKEPFFLLCCIKVSKSEYDHHFRKSILKFKEENQITKTVLHSSDIRKQQKQFNFLKGEVNKEKRDTFFQHISLLIENLNFEIYYFYIDKSNVSNQFDVYWFAVKEVLLMVNENLFNNDFITNVFCESRNQSQNQRLQNAYHNYLQNLLISSNFHIVFPRKLEFKPKDHKSYEISGLEMTDLVAFSIFKYVKYSEKKEPMNQSLLENFNLLKEKIKQSSCFKM